MKNINIEENKTMIVNLLKGVGRENTDKLLEFMDSNNFFTSPASTKYHLAVNGGLAQHSISVFKVFNRLCVDFKVPLHKKSQIVISTLHDLCKAGAYIGDWAPYSYAKGREGHAMLSLKMLEDIGYPLEDIETACIAYHMGVYGSFEYKEITGKYAPVEYPLTEMLDQHNKHPEIFLFHYSDMISTFCMERN